jgi:cytochrome c oxidase accessory protein FixG
MGIDIRDGEQLECINCALCIDACDDIMRRVGLPQGLIGYDSPHNIQCREEGTKPVLRLLRPRTVLYACVLALVAGIMLFSLSTRATIDLNVLRDRNPTYVRLADGSFRNAYTIKVMNRAGTERSFDLTVQGPRDFATKIVGSGETRLPAAILVPPDRLRTLRVLVTVPASSIASGSTPIEFEFKDRSTGETRSNRTVFLSGHDAGDDDRDEEDE